MPGGTRGCIPHGRLRVCAPVCRLLPQDYLCLSDHADYNKGLTATEDAAHMYWISGFRRPVHDDLRDGYLGTRVYNRASSWKNNTNLEWCAFDGKRLLWTMNRYSSSRWVGATANDRIDSIGPCPKRTPEARPARERFRIAAPEAPPDRAIHTNDTRAGTANGRHLRGGASEGCATDPGPPEPVTAQSVR